MATPPDPREFLAGLGVRRLPNTSLTVGPSAPTQRPSAPPQPQTPSAPQGSVLERVLSEARSTPQTQQRQQQNDQPWYKDAAATVLGNGVVQGALKPLDWLQTGGRAAVAGYENLARALPDWAENAVDAPATIASAGLNKALGVSIGDIDEERELEGNWFDRATNPEYGWGTATKDGAGLLDEALGDKWGNRARGLTGDILFDPLTYVTAGSAQAAGKSSRMSVAAKAARQGFSNEKVATIGRKGVAYLTDTERALLGVEKSGLRFAGQRIPLSGGVARTVGKATSTARHQVFGRRPWQFVARTPEGMFGVDLTEAYKVLNEANYQGRMSPRAAAALVDLDEGLRQYGKAVQVPASQVASKIFDGTNDEQRRLITKALEAGDDSALRPLNQELRRIAKEAGVELGDLGENYISHLWTKEALDFLDKVNITDAKGRTISLGPSAATKERQLKSGIVRVGKEEIDIGNGTIEEINRAFTEKFGPKSGVTKWLEDDARNITSAYIDMIRNDVAITAAFQDAIRNHPNVFDWLENVSDEVIDKVATRTANREAAKALKEIHAARKVEFKKAAAQAKVDAEQLRDVLVQRFTERAAAQDEIAQRFGRAVTAAKASGKSLDDQARQVTKEAVAVRKAADKRLAAAEKEFFEIEQKLDAAKLRLAQAQSDKARLGEYVELARRRQELMTEVDEARAARERIEELTDEAAKLFDEQRGLEANLEDPDYVREVAQSLVPDQEVEVQRLVEAPQQKMTESAARLDAVDRKLAKLNENLLDLGDAEASKLDLAVASVDDAVVAAKQAQVDAEDAVRAAIGNVARGRSQREGAAPLRSDVPLRNTVRGPQAELQQGAGAKFEADLVASTSAAMGKLDEVLGEKGKFAADWAAAGKKLREARTVESIADRHLDNLRRGEERLRGKVDDVTDRRARLLEASKGEGFREGTPDSVRAQFDEQMAAAVDKAVDEAVALRRRIWLIKDEMAKAADARMSARRSTHEAMEASRSLPRSAEPLDRQLAEAQAELDAVLGALPEPERKLLEAYDAAKKAKDKVRSLEGVRRNMERQRDRAARLSTPERQVAALENVRDILQRHLEANPSYSKPVFETVTETVPGPELPPLAQLQGDLANLPSTEPLSPPKSVRDAIEKVQVEKAPNPRDVQRGAVVSADELAVAPDEVRAAWQQITETLDPAASRADRAAQQPLLDQARRVADFVKRYKAAVDAGAEAGDELAARVTREVYRSEQATLRRRVERLSKAVDAPEGSARRVNQMKEELRSKIDEVADEVDVARKRLRAARHQLDKLGGADTGEVREQLGELASAAADRAELTFAIRQAKEDVSNLRMMLRDLIQATTKNYDDDTWRGIERAVLEIRQKGDTVKTIGARKDKALDGLWENATEATKAALFEDVRRDLADAQRAVRLAGTKKSSLGEGLPGGKMGEIRADWRDVLLDRQGDTLEARRSKLLEQVGFYDQARARIGDDIAGVDAARRENFAEQRTLKPTADRLEGAQRELDELPSVRDAGKAATQAAQAEVDDLAARQAQVVEQADALDAVLRRVDDAAADRFKEIDQQRLAAEFMVDVNGDWQKQAKNIAADLKKRASTAKGVAFGKSDESRMRAFRELDELAKVAGESPEMAQAFALHSAFVDTLARLEGEDMTIKQMEMFLKRAKEKKLTKVFKLEAQRGFRALDPTFAPGGRQIAYSDEVSAAFARLNEAAETGELWKVLDRMTQFFKTYATATPGFHVRNAMSATFMNISDGVPLKSHRDASRYWKRYLDDPQVFMREIKTENPQVHDAFQAIFGSGAGGNFSAAELGSVHNKIMDNPWTRWNRRQGERVEGVVRLAAALDTIVNRNGDVRDAMRRVERLHFDYSKLSKLDKGMKRMIPFWTFLSRNLPLQMQQMYMRPGLYSAFNHVADNIGDPVELMPQWLADRSAIAVSGNDQDGYTSFSPDLPHLNLGADLETLDVRDPLRVLSNLNPVPVAPIEALSNKNFYFDGPIGDRSDRAMHALTSIVSPVAQGMRLSGTGRYRDRRTESVANFLGIPYRNITPERMEAEMRRRAYEGE